MKLSPSLSIGFIVLLLGFPQLSETIYTPSLPDLAQNLHVKEEWAELTLSIYFIGFALGVLCWGMVADWLGRRWSMLLGLLIYIVGSGGCYYSQDIFSLLSWRFIQAYGASVGSVVTQTMIRDIYEGSARQQIFSIVGGCLALSPALGPLIGGGIDEIMGWRGNFVFLILLGSLIWTYVLMKLPETKPTSIKRVSFRHTFFQLMKDQNVLGYGFFIAACNGMIFSYYAEAPFLFMDLMHYTPTQYGFFGCVIALATISASWISHRMHKNQKHFLSILTWGWSCSGLANAGLSLAALLGVFNQNSFISLFMILSLIGLLFFGIGLIIPIALGRALISYQHVMGTASALFGLFYYILIAGFTFLMSMFHDGTALPMPLYFLVLTGLMYGVLHYCFEVKVNQYPLLWWKEKMGFLTQK